MRRRITCEGIPANRVELIRDGKLADHLTQPIEIWRPTNREFNSVGQRTTLSQGSEGCRFSILFLGVLDKASVEDILVILQVKSHLGN